MLDGSCSESGGRVVSHYRMERHVPENIVGVKEWTTTPPDDFLDALVGKVVHVVVSGTVGPQPTPFGNFFRFARVTKVEHKPASASTACARCSRGSPVGKSLSFGKPPTPLLLATFYASTVFAVL